MVALIEFRGNEIMPNKTIYATDKQLEAMNELCIILTANGVDILDPKRGVTSVSAAIHYAIQQELERQTESVERRGYRAGQAAHYIPEDKRVYASPADFLTKFEYRTYCAGYDNGMEDAQRSAQRNAPATLSILDVDP